MQVQPQVRSKPEPLLDRVQAAAFLGVSPNTLAVWACTGRYDLPFVRVGRLAKYRPEDLERWLDSRRTSEAVNA